MTSKSDMKILVTGGTGLLGRRLAERLKSIYPSHQVTVLGRNIEIGKQLEAIGIKFRCADIQDADAVLAACKHQDYVFHCASLSGTWGKYKDFYNINVVGTKNVIRGCEIYETQRLIYVSTSDVYFNYSHRLNISEADVLPEPVNGYVMTKLLAENLVDKAAQRNNKLSVITIRPGAIYSSGDKMRALITLSQKGIPLINDGKALLDLTHIDNIVDALLLCQTAPEKLSGRTFNITNGQPIQLIDLLNILSNQLGYKLKLKSVSYPVADKLALTREFISKRFLFSREPILTRYMVGLLAFSQTLNITAAKSELKYQPCFNIESISDIA